MDAVAEAATVRDHIHLVAVAAVAKRAGVEAHPATPRFAVAVAAVALTLARVPDHHAVVPDRKESRSHQPINRSDSFDWSFSLMTKNFSLTKFFMDWKGLEWVKFFGIVSMVINFFFLNL